MASGKKFNIWVAYSDLFSNLAIFLFISAFGAFAALGISLSQKVNRDSCAVLPSGVDVMLKQSGTDGGPSRIVSLKKGKVAGNDCVTRYAVTGALHGEDIAAPGANDTQSPLQVDVADHICRQIWGAITRASLASNDGQVVIVGTIGAVPGAFKACKEYGDDHPFKKDGNTRSRILAADCWLNRHRAGGDVKFLKARCAALDTCEKGENGTGYPCMNANGDVLRDVVRRQSCLEMDAARQAEALYMLCRRSVVTTGFRFGLIWQKDSVVENHKMDYDLLSTIWDNRVRYRGEVGNDPSGSVYIDVVFDKAQSSPAHP